MLTAEDKVFIDKNYPDSVELALAFQHHVVQINGVWRWERSTLIQYLANSRQVDLNRMRVDYRAGRFKLVDYIKFYMDLGYSLAGFEEIFDAGQRAYAIKYMNNRFASIEPSSKPDASKT